MSETHRIFAGALELDGAARAAWLDAQCGGDAALRRDVEQLLRADAEDHFLPEHRLAALRQGLAVPDEPLPERIGAFRILGVLGHGGMSVVYRAEQEQPRREVALKVLAPGLGGTSGRTRLALEAEALGRLQHPGIAQVFAAGTFRSATGEQPYLAMELVRGVTLLQWTRAFQRPLGERLRMLTAIADAVHHAHQRGLIHRDLKPGNVLVDERGQCKVLDFGIARLLDGDSGRAPETLHGQLLGTLAYMSPEQASGDVGAVDVRSDVYSLGVIAYEMLAGTLPIDVGTESIPRGLQRLVSEEPLPLGRRDRTLRGDLETIVACALRKEPARRYASMAAFADDLRRLLAHEPIQARPATAAYVLARFVQRHALVVAAAAAVVLGLGIALVASLQATARIEEARQEEQQARIDAERKEAEARRQEQIKGDVLAVLGEVFGASDPRRNSEARHQPLAVRLQAAMDRLGERFHSSPETERAVRMALAQTLVARGEFAAATPHLHRVLALPAAAEQDEFTARFQLAQCQWRQGALDDALATLDGIGAACPRLGAGDASKVATLRGQVLWKRGDRELAVELWQETLAHVETRPAAFPPTTAAQLRSSLAGALYDEGRYDQAAALVGAAIDTLTRSYGPEAEETLTALNTQAAVLLGKGETERAAALMEQVLRAWTHVFGDDHPEQFVVLQNHAATRARLGDIDAAVAGFERSIAFGERVYGADAAELAPALANLGTLRQQQKRLAEAAALYQRAIDNRQAKRPEPDKLLSGYYYDLARIRRDLGDDAAHYELAQRSLAIRIAALGPFHELVLTRRVEMAWLHARHDRRRDAIAELRAVDDQLVAVLGRQHRATIDAARYLATFLLDEGDTAAAPQWIAALRARAAGTRDAAAIEAEAKKLEARLAAPR